MTYTPLAVYLNRFVVRYFKNVSRSHSPLARLGIRRGEHRVTASPFSRVKAPRLVAAGATILPLSLPFRPAKLMKVNSASLFRGKPATACCRGGGGGDNDGFSVPHPEIRAR